jgi:CRP/FNR family transcriptional regulator
VLGFEALAMTQQLLTVVALEDSSVYALPLRELDVWRRQSAPLDHALQRALCAQLASATDIAGMMAAVAAEVRLARFLVWMSARMAARGQSPHRLFLRMSRRDIASLLAVAHETVSRGFAVLAASGYVTVDNREVEIRDMEGLKACTRYTRRETDEAPRRHWPSMANGYEVEQLFAPHGGPQGGPRERSQGPQAPRC